MTDEYTPTINDVREMWAEYQDLTWGRFEDHLEEFDRFIRKVKADTLREAAEEARYQLGDEASGHTSTYSVRKWLNERAKQIQG